MMVYQTNSKADPKVPTIIMDGLYNAISNYNRFQQIDDHTEGLLRTAYRQLIDLEAQYIIGEVGRMVFMTTGETVKPPA